MAHPAENYLRIEMEHRQQQDQLVPKGIVHRNGVPVAIASMDPGCFPAFAATAIALFDAEAVMVIVDVWLSEEAMDEHGDDKRSPSERFDQGDPRSSEALVGQWVTPEGVTMLVAKYRKALGTIVFDDMKRMPQGFIGRIAVDVEDVRRSMRVAKLANMRAVIAAEGMTRAEADVSVAESMAKLPGITSIVVTGFESA